MGCGSSKDASGGQFQIRIRRTTSVDLWLPIFPSTTVLNVKRAIWEDGAIAPESQRLTFNGRVLDNDDETLTQAGVGSEAELWVEVV